MEKGRSPCSVRHKTFVNRPPDAVYQALATASGLDGWFTTGAHVDSKPGGTIRFEWKRFGAEKITATDIGTVLEATPNSRFAFTWSPGSSETRVVIDLAPHAGGTMVTLQETGFKDDDEGLETMLGVAVGWGEALTLLKFWLEAGLRYKEVP